MIPQMQPVTCVDWESVTHVRVTLEKPYKGGGFRRRHGTAPSKRNLSFNAHDPDSGPPHWPGAPIMYPADAPAVAGDKARDSWVMPKQDAFTMFGHFYAPLEVKKNGLIGLTLSAERERVAMYWGWYKMPPGDGTMHPPMNRLGPPALPDVAIRPLDGSMLPISVDGEEVVIRPRDFFDFDNPNNYDIMPAKAGEVSGLEGLTREELEGLRELVKAKRGKPATG